MKNNCEKVFGGKRSRMMRLDVFAERLFLLLSNANETIKKTASTIQLKKEKEVGQLNIVRTTKQTRQNGTWIATDQRGRT